MNQEREIGPFLGIGSAVLCLSGNRGRCQRQGSNLQGHGRPVSSRRKSGRAGHVVTFQPSSPWRLTVVHLASREPAAPHRRLVELRQSTVSLASVGLTTGPLCSLVLCWMRGTGSPAAALAIVDGEGLVGGLKPEERLQKLSPWRGDGISCWRQPPAVFPPARCLTSLLLVVRSPLAALCWAELLAGCHEVQFPGLS